MFNKVLASIGIGAAQVDTHVHNNNVYPGEILRGHIDIKGGKTEQKINDIYLYLITTYVNETDDSTFTSECCLKEYRLCESFTINPHQQETISFSLEIPYETPLTIYHQPVYLRTGLDISLAVDPKDQDLINIKPHPLMQLFFDGLNRLGFQLKSVKCEAHYSSYRPYPFIQEFEFRPGSKYHRYLDELEVTFILTQNELIVFLEIDRKSKGITGWFADALDVDESHTRFIVYPEDLNYSLDNFENRLAQFIESYL